MDFWFIFIQLSASREFGAVNARLAARARIVLFKRQIQCATLARVAHFFCSKRMVRWTRTHKNPACVLVMQTSIG